MVIPASGESLITSIKKYKITHLSIVSIQLQRLLNEPDIKETAGYLKAVLLGGSAFSEKLINQAYDLNLKLYTTYGLTEMASQVTTTTAGDSKEKKLTSGKLLKHREIKINNSGEILVRGKTLFKGYFHQRKLITPFDDEGWLATSDLGNIDSDGYLTVTGRKDNMFISGGENIHPEEIEQVLTCSDNIETAIVVPVSDNEYGFRPVAFIRYKDKKTKFNSNDLNLPHYKIPIRFFDLAADLLNNSLKPNRKRLQELAEKLIKN
ncbi:MAG: AMP-binding protein [Candidatus Zixiibacteriota bacterium]